jgi:integrase
VKGDETTPKTTERTATLAILDEVRVPLELSRKKCDRPKTAWLSGDRPVDLHNIIARVIRPHVDVAGERYGKECKRCKVIPKASRVEWRGMHSARRGAITHASNVSGSIPVGQRLARHASAQTTATFYRKGMPDRMFIDGMKGLNRKHD